MQGTHTVIRLIVLMLFSFVSARAMYFLLKDAEGTNLLVTTVTAAFLLTASLCVHARTKEILLPLLTQILLTILLYLLLLVV